MPGRAAYSMPHLVADVRALIERLGGGRAVLVGNDWGGLVAWTFASEHPELLDGMVVLNTPHPALFVRAWPGHRSSCAARTF
jgi:pimeloyl-ACP methyl ester carboxylesterase